MPKTKNGENTCPEGGVHTEERYKTWDLVASFPDKHTRITVATMGMCELPQCGKKFRTRVSKAKLSSKGIEV
jgi:hypothetical protein